MAAVSTEIPTLIEAYAVPVPVPWVDREVLVIFVSLQAFRTGPLPQDWCLDRIQPLPITTMMLP